MDEIERIDKPTQQVVEACVASGKPFIFNGLIDDWKAISLWNLDYLNSVAGDRHLPIEVYPDGNFYSSWLSLDMEVGRYIQLLKGEPTPERYYMAEVRIANQLPELLDDINTPAIVGEESFASLFVGDDCTSALHYHAKDHALLCQVVGEKRMTLFSPEDFPFLYFEPWYSNRFNFSRIDFRDVGHPYFPAFCKATPLRCVLKPKDALFIPIHWGHLTEGIGTTFSVTFFWTAEWKDWHYWRPSFHALAGTKFRSYISRPIAAWLEKTIGYRIIRQSPSVSICGAGQIGSARRARQYLFYTRKLFRRACFFG